MDEAPSIVGRRGRRLGWRLLLVVGVLGLAAVAMLSRASGPPGAASSADKQPIIYAGTGTRTTPPFHLAGGTYRTLWSAWERAPEYPPCTHSAELMAVDAVNATASGGHVVDLARMVQVPATGASDESYVVNVKPGDYYLVVDSACAWQIAITPN